MKKNRKEQERDEKKKQQRATKMSFSIYLPIHLSPFLYIYLPTNVYLSINLNISNCSPFCPSISAEREESWQVRIKKVMGGRERTLLEEQKQEIEGKGEGEGWRKER